jgi:hypothetical protein
VNCLNHFANPIDSANVFKKIDEISKRNANGLVCVIGKLDWFRPQVKRNVGKEIEAIGLDIVRPAWCPTQNRRASKRAYPTGADSGREFQVPDRPG